MASVKKKESGKRSGEQQLQQRRRSDYQKAKTEDKEIVSHELAFDVEEEERPQIRDFATSSTDGGIDPQLGIKLKWRKIKKKKVTKSTGKEQAL